MHLVVVVWPVVVAVASVDPFSLAGRVWVEWLLGCGYGHPCHVYRKQHVSHREKIVSFNNAAEMMIILNI